MSPERYIEETDYINGYKVITRHPILSEAEYEKIEREITEAILNMEKRIGNGESCKKACGAYSSEERTVSIRKVGN